MEKLDRSFYLRPTLLVARELLGKVLHKDGMEVMIVETEAYIGPLDRGCHAYNHRRTPKNEVMYGPPGHAYVYLIYGLYHCLNAVTEEEGKACAVLLRGAQPLAGLSDMCLNRFGKSLSDVAKTEIVQLANGPGKLCMAMGITREWNGKDLTGDRFFLRDNPDHFEVVTSRRINIDYAGESKDYPWRFYIKDHPCVSRK